MAALFFLAFAPASYSSTLFLTQDICVNATCSGASPQSSYSGSNAGTGESDYSGAIYKGSSDPLDTFDEYGMICTAPGSTCADYGTPGFTYGNEDLVTITRQTEMFYSEGYYRFLDTFTNNTSTDISGDIVFYGNIPWLPGGGESNETPNPGCGSPTSSLYVECDDGSGLMNDQNDRPAIAMVAGNDSWAASNISYALDGRSPTFIIQVDLTPGQSISILQFVVLDANADGSPDVADAESLATSLQNNPNLSGFTATQIDSIANFDTPEPGTFSLVGAFLAFGFIAARRRRA